MSSSGAAEIDWRVFGWLFHRRRSVVAPAVAHFVFDALSLLPR